VPLLRCVSNRIQRKIDSHPEWLGTYLKEVYNVLMVGNIPDSLERIRDMKQRERHIFIARFFDDTVYLYDAVKNKCHPHRLMADIESDLDFNATSTFAVLPNLDCVITGGTRYRPNSRQCLYIQAGSWKVDAKKSMIDMRSEH
jgi:hypothetical protein